MKPLKFYFPIIMLLLAQSSYSQYAKVNMSSFSEEQIQEVYYFVEQAFSSCNEAPDLKSKFAKTYFRKQLEGYDYKYYCKKQVEYYGNLTDIELIEVVSRNDYKVFRYKVKRSEADWFSEIRVYLDEKDRISNLSTKYFWADTYYNSGEYPPIMVVDTSLIKDSLVKQNNDFAFKSFNNCNTTELFEVNETNGIYRMIRNDWTKVIQKECNTIKTSHGNFKDLKFTEYLTDSISLKVYRYKVDFDKLNKSSEIRIYSKLDDKYSGIYVVDVWYDQFFDLKQAKEKSQNELGN